MQTAVEQASVSSFFHLHCTEELTLQASAATTAKQVRSIWETARIPSRKECHVIDKIKNLHKTWQSLHKNASRKTHTAEEGTKFHRLS
jgi:hypothetical protein